MGKMHTNESDFVFDSNAFVCFDSDVKPKTFAGGTERVNVVVDWRNNNNSSIISGNSISMRALCDFCVTHARFILFVCRSDTSRWKEKKDMFYLLLIHQNNRHYHNTHSLGHDKVTDGVLNIDFQTTVRGEVGGLLHGLLIKVFCCFFVVFRSRLVVVRRSFVVCRSLVVFRSPFVVLDFRFQMVIFSNSRTMAWQSAICCSTCQ